MNFLNRLLLIVLLTTCSMTVAQAQIPADLDQLFAKAARAHHVPEAVLRSICQIESKGNPWAINLNGISFQPSSKREALHLLDIAHQRPWVLSLKYKDQKPSYSFFKSEKAARRALSEIYSNNHRWYLQNPKRTQIRKLDVRSIDIGLMQINHLFHGRHFASKEALFDTKTNVFYAAKYLRQLLNRHGTIKKAVAFYHSNTKKYQTIYLSHFWPVYQKLLIPPKKA